MEEKRGMDTFGAVSLTLFSALLAFNSVVIKVTNSGLQPVFSAGLRSVGAAIVLLIFFRIARRSLSIPQGALPGLILGGLAFSVEFTFLYTALDLTTVSRASVIFYSMPVWLALGAHFMIPGDQLTPKRGLGLAFAMAGVAWAILARPDSGTASLTGDLYALAASVSWAVIGLSVRATKAREASSEVQLLFHLGISAVFLLVAAQAFGPLVRDITWMTYAGMGFQVLVVASAAFLFWLWLMKIYPASSVASFSFLSPVFGVIFGWWLLSEDIGISIFGSLALVAVGLFLINRK